MSCPVCPCPACVAARQQPYTNYPITNVPWPNTSGSFDSYWTCSMCGTTVPYGSGHSCHGLPGNSLGA